MIETERLILRNFKSDTSDIDALYAIMSDPVVNQYLPWFPLKTISEANDFYQTKILPRYTQQNGFYFAICLKEENKPIGYVTVSGDKSHDLGYGLRQDFWGQGIVTEAVATVVELLKDSSWNYITATHDINNLASGKVMEKIGMSYQYSYKELWQPKNILVSFRMYQLNFAGSDFVYRAYWDKYPEHFIEKL